MSDSEKQKRVKWRNRICRSASNRIYRSQIVRSDKLGLVDCTLPSLG